MAGNNRKKTANKTKVIEKAAKAGLLQRRLQ